MTTYIIMRSFILVIPVLAVATAQSPRPKLANEQWVELFNRKDLAGWVNIGKEKWEVQSDGSIQGMAVTKEYGYLQTEKKYRDFQLSLSFKCIGTGNSGVFFHTDFKPGTADVSQGYQFEVDCSLGRHTGGIYTARRQWIVWPAPENESVVRRGEWNEYLLEVNANRYISRLNGVTMVDFTDPKPEADDGYIALQLHSGGEGHMLFRDILIRDLTSR
jgi:hypothetical protein